MLERYKNKKKSGTRITEGRGFKRTGILKENKGSQQRLPTVIPKKM